MVGNFFVLFMDYLQLSLKLCIPMAKLKYFGYFVYGLVIQDNVQ